MFKYRSGALLWMTLSLSVSSRTLIKDLLCRYTVPGTAAFKVSIQKIYKGNTPAFYNYFIGLLLFFVFLAFASLHNLNISSKVSTAFKENLFRKWSSTPCLPPSLLWRPTTKWYKLYGVCPHVWLWANQRGKYSRKK